MVCSLTRFCYVWRLFWYRSTMNKKGFFSLICLLILSIASAQKYPQNYFQSPLDIPLYVSGTFGELRSNHFHAGIDLKTQGQEGKRVLAAAEGYISRINVSSSGYGKAIYINHPNGFMTVYAHLQRFNEEIEAYVREHQYRKETFELTLYPSPGQLKVSQGQVIALSGNTGGSGGPHLHYEIRDQGGERALNPLLFGLNINDRRAPKLFRVKLYEIDHEGNIRDERVVDIAPGGNGIYRPVNQTSIKLHNTFAVGVQGYDHQDGSENKNGIYRVAVLVNDTAYFSFQADGIRFDQSRYINAFVDYPAKKNKGQTYYRLYEMPNYNLDAHPERKERGIIHINDSGSFTLKMEALDFHGNRSEVHIPLDLMCKDFSSRFGSATVWQYSMSNTINDRGIRATLAPMSLYEDAVIEYKIEEACSNCLTPVFGIGRTDIPIHRNLMVSFDRSLIESDLPREKMVVVRRDHAGAKWQSIGADENNSNHLMAYSKTFGQFSVMSDLIAPRVYPINFGDGQSISDNKPIHIHISDDFSGISKYAAYVNDEWILMEYEPKSNLLFYTFDGKLSKGKNTLRLVVWDNCNNKTEKTWSIVRP